MSRSLLAAVAMILAVHVAAGDAVAQIPAAEYAQRRAALAAAVGDGVIVGLADTGGRGIDLNFRYLTGLLERDAVLVMVSDRGRLAELLFLNPRSFTEASWDGETLTLAEASSGLGVIGRELRELQTVMDSLLATHDRVSVLGGYNPGGAVLTPSTQRIQRMLASRPNTTVGNVGREVNALRAIKSEAELELVRKTVAITTAAHRDIMRKARPGLNEFELQALAEYTFGRYGAEGPGFSSIVASGANATILHYNTNTRFIEDGDLVKVDIGANYGGYVADVTRTFPANGRFSPAQREVYQIVRDAQAAAEAVARPGEPRARMTQEANRVLSAGLARIGLIEAPDAVYDCPGPGGRTNECPQLRLFYFHGLGHGIGLNVHDPWPNTLEVGTAFTIEPGIYVRPALLETLPDTPRNRAMIQRIRPAFERYKGIGVRIEDDYIITANGLEWLSTAPREVAEIEALMAEPWTGPSPRDPAMVEWYRRMR